MIRDDRKIICHFHVSWHDTLPLRPSALIVFYFILLAIANTYCHATFISLVPSPVIMKAFQQTEGYIARLFYAFSHRFIFIYTTLLTRFLFDVQQPSHSRAYAYQPPLYDITLLPFLSSLSFHFTFILLYFHADISFIYSYYCAPWLPSPCIFYYNFIVVY